MIDRRAFDTKTFCYLRPLDGRLLLTSSYRSKVEAVSHGPENGRSDRREERVHAKLKSRRAAAVGGLDHIIASFRPTPGSRAGNFERWWFSRVVSGPDSIIAGSPTRETRFRRRRSRVGGLDPIIASFARHKAPSRQKTREAPAGPGRPGPLRTSPREGRDARLANEISNARSLVDPASSHMLVSKIKPCKSQYIPN